MLVHFQPHWPPHAKQSAQTTQLEPCTHMQCHVDEICPRDETFLLRLEEHLNDILLFKAWKPAGDEQAQVPWEKIGGATMTCSQQGKFKNASKMLCQWQRHGYVYQVILNTKNNEEKQTAKCKLQPAHFLRSPSKPGAHRCFKKFTIGLACDASSM